MIISFLYFLFSWVSLNPYLSALNPRDKGTFWLFSQAQGQQRENEANYMGQNFCYFRDISLVITEDSRVGCS